MDNLEALLQKTKLMLFDVSFFTMSNLEA